MRQNRSIIFTRVLIANSLLLTLTLPVYATAEQNDKKNDDVDVITVIGSVAKTGEMRFYDPQSVASVSQQTIAQQNFEKVDQALSYTSGALQGMYGNDSKTNWLKMRGLDVSYTFNGSPAITTGYFGETADIYGVEQVEVVKGANSFLYGASKPGGTVNLISKRPTDSPQGQIKTYWGSDHNQGIAGDYSGILTDDNSVRYRLVGTYRDRDGQQDYTNYKSYYLAPSLIWDIDNQTAVTFLASIQKTHGIPENGFLPAYGTLISPPMGKIDKDTFFGEPGYNYYSKDNQSLSYEFKHIFDNEWTFSQNYRYSHEKVDIKGVYASYADELNGKMVRNSFGQKGSVDSHTIDNRLTKTFNFADWTNSLLVGFEYQHTKMSGQDYNNYGDSLTDLYHPSYGYKPNEPYSPFLLKAQEYGIYLQNQLVYDYRLILNQGIRYNKIKNNGYWSGADFDRDYNHTTFNLGAMYVFDNDVSPYMSYSESFTPVYGYSDSQQTLYKPYSAKQWEVGIKYAPDWLQGEMTFDYFHIKAQNAFTSNGTGQAAQTLETLSKGIEFQLKTQLTEQINWNAAYTYTDATTDLSPTRTVQSPMIPKHSIATWIDYQFTQGVFDGLTIGSGIRYVGKTKDEANLPAGTVVPSYTVWDAMIKYDISRDLNLQLNAANLTNKSYIASCNYWCYYGAERNVTATLSYHF
ncbi:TonB-dependent siderophore receptor [Orbus sturtevantii]|uniref:TonB-dependent siderophore receptor n=1 Tax=Orbus sturtevantii TaxID=3074109 RepID=UPI00370D4A9A